MRNERQLVEQIVSLLDELFGERSEKAKFLASDIANSARDTGNESVGRVFDSVTDHYRYS